MQPQQSDSCCAPAARLLSRAELIDKGDMEDINPTCCSNSRRGGILLMIHVPAPAATLCVLFSNPFLQQLYGHTPYVLINGKKQRSLTRSGSCQGPAPV